MAQRDRETVVVDGGRDRTSYGWLIALLVIVGLIILFFLFGGMNLFNGGSDSQTVNVDTPDTVKVEPGTQP